MSVVGATAVQDYKIDITDADTEYSQELSGSVREITIQCRDATDLKCSFTEGAVDGSSPTGPYFTVKSGTVLKLQNLCLNNPTLYVAAGTGSKVAEVLVGKVSP